MKNNKRYFVLITIGVIFVFVFNLLFYFSLISILDCLISFAIVIAPCALVIFLIRFFPTRWFDPNRKVFHVYKFESKLYESINIRKWKNKLPEPGKALFRFDKSKVTNPKDPEYLMLFLYENCRGSSCHLFCFVWGFASLPIIGIVNSVLLPKEFTFMTFTAGLLIATLHGIIHLASLITLRYMRPRLMKLYKLNKEHLENKSNEEAEKLKENTENVKVSKQTNSKAKSDKTKNITKNMVKTTKKQQKTT